MFIKIRYVPLRTYKQYRMSESPEPTTPIQFFPTTPPAEVAQGRITLQLEDDSRVVMSRDIANQFPIFNAILADLPLGENMVIPVMIEYVTIDDIKSFFTNYTILMNRTQLRQPATILTLIEYLTIADHLGGGIILDRIIDRLLKNAKLQYTPAQQQLLRDKYNFLSNEVKALVSNKLLEIPAYELVSDVAEEWTGRGLTINKEILITNEGRVINLVRKSDSEYDLRLNNQVLTTLTAPRNKSYDPSQFHLSYFFIGEFDPSDFAIMVTSLFTNNRIMISIWTGGGLINKVLTQAYHPKEQRHKKIKYVISATNFSNKLLVSSVTKEELNIERYRGNFFIVEVSPLTGEATIKFTGRFGIIMEPKYGQYALVDKTRVGGRELYDLNTNLLLSEIPFHGEGILFLGGEEPTYTIDQHLHLIYVAIPNNRDVKIYDFSGTLVSTSQTLYSTYPAQPARETRNTLHLNIYPHRRIITSEFWVTNQIIPQPPPLPQPPWILIPQPLLIPTTERFFKSLSYNIRDPSQDWRLISTIQDFDVSQTTGPNNLTMQSQLVSSENHRYIIIKLFQQDQLIKAFMRMDTKDQIIYNLMRTES